MRGTILWSYHTDGRAAAGLAITHDRNVLASAGPALYCVRDGKLRWKFSGDNDAKALPAIHDQSGNIYFGKGSDFYALSSGGKELWRVRLLRTRYSSAGDGPLRPYLRLHCSAFVLPLGVVKIEVGDPLPRV